MPAAARTRSVLLPVCSRSDLFGRQEGRKHSEAVPFLGSCLPKRKLGKAAGHELTVTCSQRAGVTTIVAEPEVMGTPTPQVSTVDDVLLPHATAPVHEV